MLAMVKCLELNSKTKVLSMFCVAPQTYTNKVCRLMSYGKSTVQLEYKIKFYMWPYFEKLLAYAQFSKFILLDFHFFAFSFQRYSTEKLVKPINKLLCIKAKLFRKYSTGAYRNKAYFVYHEFVHSSTFSIHHYIILCSIRKVDLVWKYCSQISLSPQHTVYEQLQPRN